MALVKFYSPGCAASKKMAPQWLQLGGRYAGRADVLVGEVDCLAHPALCARDRYQRGRSRCSAAAPLEKDPVGVQHVRMK